MTDTRSILFNIRMRPDELEKLKRLAEADGLSAADVVRQLVLRAYDARFAKEKKAR